MRKTDSRWEKTETEFKTDWIEEKFVAASPTNNYFGQYALNLTIPTDYVAYILCGTDSYFLTDDYSSITSAGAKIFNTIKSTDRRMDTDILIDEVESNDKGYPYGYEFYCYQHGALNKGAAVVWPSEDYHDDHCDCGGNFEGIGNRYGNEVLITHVVHINNDRPIEIFCPYAISNTTKVIDKVFVVLKDLDGNYYEPYEFGVPFELFANAPTL